MCRVDKYVDKIDQKRAERVRTPVYACVSSWMDTFFPRISVFGYATNTIQKVLNHKIRDCMTVNGHKCVSILAVGNHE